MSELDSVKVSFTELEKHGFNVSAPLARINKLVALKDRQLKKMKEQKSLNKQMMAFKEEFDDMHYKLRQQEAMKEQICEMESFARDRGIELDNLEPEFKAISSAPC